MLRRWSWSSMTTKRRKQHPEERRVRIGLIRVNMRSRVKAMSSSSENWMTASMRLETAASAAKVKSVCGAKSQRANAAPPKVSCPEIKVVDAIAGEGARATLAPISSGVGEMPGLLGTTRRLGGESQRNQRDHC